MLKGNLIVGKNQSVVVRAESLHDLVKLAETKSRYCHANPVAAETGADGLTAAPLSLRIDLAQCGIAAEELFGSEETLLHRNR